MEEYSDGVVHEKIDPEFISELEKYEKLYLAVKEKEKEEKAKNKATQNEAENENQTNEQEQREEEGIIVTPGQIEEKTSDARISEINGETQGIREEYIRETQEKEVGREDESVGNEARA